MALSSAPAMALNLAGPSNSANVGMTNGDDPSTNSDPQPVNANIVSEVCRKLNISADVEGHMSNTFINNPQFKELVAAEKMKIATAQLHASYSRKQYVCKHVTDPEKIRRLQANFPKFSICAGSQPAESNNHPFARELRGIEMADIFEHVFRYTEDVKLADGYDVYVKDIGGNPIVHDMAGRGKVHCCCPAMNCKDHIRASNWTNHIETFGQSANVNPKKHPLVYSALNDRKLICHCLGQNCSVKAPYMLLLHSSYDVTTDELGTMCDQANSNVVVLQFLFCPTMFFASSGELPGYDCRWRKYMLNGVVYIEFAFDSDNTPHYIHTFDTYTSLIRGTYFRTPSGVHYATEHDFRDCSLRIIMRKVHGRIHHEQIRRHLNFSDDKSVVVVACYDYELLRASDNPMVPVLVHTPKDYWKMICQYAASLKDTKFTSDNLKTFALAMNNKRVVGTTVVDGGGLDVQDVNRLANTAYMMTYIQNYGNSQALRILTEDEKRIREYHSSCWIRQLFSRFNRKNAGLKSHPLAGEKGTYTDKDLDKFAKQASLLTNRSAFIKLFEDMFGSHPNRKYPLEVMDSQVYEISEIIQDSDLRAPVLTYSYSHPPTTSAYLTSPDVIKYSTLADEIRKNPDLMTVAAVVAGSDDPVETKFRENEGCGLDLECVTVPGDGNCFYHCVIRALKLITTPEEFKSRLMRSKYLDMLCMEVVDDTLIVNETRLKKAKVRLSPCSNPADATYWANDFITLLTSLEFKICICVHTETGHYRYNSKVSSVVSTPRGMILTGTTVHLHHSGTHYDLLTEVFHECPCAHTVVIEIDASAKGPFFLEDEAPLADIYGPVLKSSDNRGDAASETDMPSTSSTMNVDDYKIAASSSIYAQNNNPFASVNKYGYSSFYGPMLSMAVKESGFVIDRNTAVLDIDDRNLSSLQYWCDATEAIVASGVFSSSGRLSGVHRSPAKRVPIRKRSSDDEFNYARVFGAGCFYSIVCLNPAFYSDSLSSLSPRCHNEHINRNVRSFDLVSTGKMWICAFTLPMTPYVAALVKVMCECANVRLVRPTVMPEYLPWAFIVATDKSKNITAEQYAYLSDQLNATSKDDNAYSSVISTAFSINMCDLMRAEVELVSTKSYMPPSQGFAEHYRSQVPRRKYVYTSGGYLSSIPLPTSTSVKAPAEYPSFDMDFIKDNFYDHASMLMPKKFGAVVEKYCRDLTVHVCKKNNITLGNMPQVLRALGGELSEFDKRFLYSYYITARNGGSYLNLNLKSYDLGKPLMSSMFYTSSVITSLRAFVADFKDFITNTEIEPARSLDDDIIPYPTNTELFEPSVIPSTHFYLPLSELGARRGDDSDDADQEYVSAGYEECGYELTEESNDRLREEAARQFWMPGAYADSSNYRSKFANYYSEFMSLNSLQVTNVLKENTNVLRNVMKHYEPGSKVFSNFVTTCMGKAYADNAVLCVHGTQIYGGQGGLEVALERKFVMVYDYDVKNRNVYNCRLIRTPTDLAKQRHWFSTIDMTVHVEQDFLNASTDVHVSSMGKKFDISTVQAGPGCGKTFTIIQEIANNPNKKYLALMKNRDNAKAARIRLRTVLSRLKCPKLSPNDLRRKLEDCVQSIDSFICHSAKNPPKLEKVFIDEAMTQHPGKIVMACAIAQCDVLLYGDAHQIPYGCRVNGANLAYPEVSKAFPITSMLDVSYRIPQDVAFALSSRYAPIADALGIKYPDPNLALKTNSKETFSMKVAEIASVDNIPIENDTQYLTINQSELEILKKTKGKLCKLPMKTVHEYQGEENPNVALVRLDLQDNMSVPGGAHNSDGHYVSAISRHTRKFTYYTVKVGDKISTSILENEEAFRRFNITHPLKVHNRVN